MFFPTMRHAYFIISLALITANPCFAQQESENANVSSTIRPDGTGIITIEARGPVPEPPVFFSASANATAVVGFEHVEQSIGIDIRVVQGKAKTLSLELQGNDEVTAATGENLKSWAVRKADSKRFLDLKFVESADQLSVSVTLRSAKYKLPSEVELTHIAPGEAIGFLSTIAIQFAPEVEGKMIAAEGFAPLESKTSSGKLQSFHFQTSKGGQVKLSLGRSGSAPSPVELVDTKLDGKLLENGKSIQFTLLSTAKITQPNAEVTILSGNAAVSSIPSSDQFRLRLDTTGEIPAYKLLFPEAGEFPIAIDFIANLITSDSGGHSIDFKVAASAIVPLTLEGIEKEFDFHRDQESVAPLLRDDKWVGFLPANGRAKLQWKSARKASEGKLFFTANSRVEAKVGTGLLRQEHTIHCQVLQGELKSLSISLRGSGEILDVQGTNLVAWKVSGADGDRQLDITLSQPITAESEFSVRSQTPLDAFPIRVEGLRLNPIGVIRHSGYLRLTNLGSVSVEPTGLAGLTQLSPNEYPGEAIEARQVFVYRFPAAQYALTVIADRIQPEVNVSQLAIYQLTDADRVIKADVELDIREAPIREWEFLVPSDYSVVSVTGANVSDYISATESADGNRKLKVIFGNDVDGRQLVVLHLEKSEAAEAGQWELPRIEYPGAKTVRGDIGVTGSPGFRIGISTTNLLVEKPLSYFPKPSPELQQAFRIREPQWSATLVIELLDQSIQSDLFHLYSLSDETVYGSALINYFVTGSPVSEWKINVPQVLGNVLVDGQDVRTWRRDGDTLVVSLHQPVMGAYTLLITFEEKPDPNKGTFRAGQVAPLKVQGERGYVQVVSPMQVEMVPVNVSESLLKLDPLELPAEFRLLSTAPSLGAWQYTQRPLDLNLKVNWFEPGTTVTQVVEFAEANSRVSVDGELVTDILYYIKTRGERTLKIVLPPAPVRLWEVSVDGQPVTARQTDDATLIPLSDGTDPNRPIEVRLRLGKPSVDALHPHLMLPIVFAPVLKTQWNITGDDKHVLVPGKGTVAPPVPVLRPMGFDWVAKRGLAYLLLITVFFTVGTWVYIRSRQSRSLWITACVVSFSSLAIATSIVATVDSASNITIPTPLLICVPILSAGETIELGVSSKPLWLVNLSWEGLLMIVLGILGFAWSMLHQESGRRLLMRMLSILLIAVGILIQRDGSPWFFAFLAFAIFLFLFLQTGRDFMRQIRDSLRSQTDDSTSSDESASNPSGIAPSITTAILLFALTIALHGTTLANSQDGFTAADSINQQWTVTHRDMRLTSNGTIVLTGEPGDRFLLLRSPAVLTQFEGEGLRLVKEDVADQGLAYVLSIPTTGESSDSAVDELQTVRTYTAKFEYQLESLKPSEGMPVLTGNAAVQEIDFQFDEAGWEIQCATAVLVQSVEADDVTKVRILLGPGRTSLFLKTKARDVSNEEKQFFVEASNLYLPGPGVVDGVHHLRVRLSQGQLNELSVAVPSGLTVSSVTGPVGSWQFDADTGMLRVAIEPIQSQAFDIQIETQRGLDPLPAELKLMPLKVENASGEVGLLGIAFGPDAQPETVQPQGMSAVNLGDFDTNLMANRQVVLHRVYRYGAAGGELSVRVSPVESEVRVISKQALSLGDERVVLAVNFVAEISRAGLFQLSFPLPSGLEVESLSGDAIHHWAELTDGDQRQVVMHLNGKTIGNQNFALTLAGAAPTEDGDWEIPRFEINEAARQLGDLVVRPTTGIRLRSVTRQNVSETDPRTLGGQTQGSLAFRLLQRQWNLVLGIEKLEPWVTGQMLHEVILREGQTRTTLVANVTVQNASINSLQIALPITNEDEIKTLRATGETVSDFVRTGPDSNTWELQFKRRVVGKVDFRIEYERRGDRLNDAEIMRPASITSARQLEYYFAVRAGGRLDLEHDPLAQGWQQSDWNMVPATLRDAVNRSAPAFALRAVSPANGLVVHAKRHSLADALKLRVAAGSLTTVLSPNGEQLTAVDVTIEVIQRSSLGVGLPDGGELFSIFVNGESVNSVRSRGKTNAWQFYILPGIDDRTAKVRFVYSVPGDRLSRIKLTGPELNVPLENIQWNVIAPKGFELVDNEGNLELVSRSNEAQYDRQSYLSKVSGKREVQAKQAADLLQQANQFLQEGEQTKAHWALNSVANQYALDAASNEDARVQLENLQTQQAIVGLNTRRQRLYIDNYRNEPAASDNQQLREAAADNPILQQDQLNFRPQQLSELLRGNTSEDNAVLQQIAMRLVQHQHTTQPAPQAILISLPEEGSVYTFSRSVQVAENSPLELDLSFASQYRVPYWQAIALTTLLVLIAGVVAATSLCRNVASPSADA